MMLSSWAWRRTQFTIGHSLLYSYLLRINSSILQTHHQEIYFFIDGDGKCEGSCIDISLFHHPVTAGCPYHNMLNVPVAFYGDLFTGANYFVRPGFFFYGLIVPWLCLRDKK